MGLPSLPAGVRAQTKKPAGGFSTSHPIDLNPGTPWALLAQRELKDPLGLKIEEAYVAPPPPPPKAKAGPAAKVVPPKIVPNVPGKQPAPQPNMLPRPKEVKLPKL